MTLEDELKYKLEDTIAGQNHGPQLAGRLTTAARGVLFRHGLGAARVSVRRIGSGMEVMVQLPPNQPRVRQLVIRLG